MSKQDRFELHFGNCLDVLKTVEANSVHAIVTDPPYGLSFMGKKWDYDVPSVDIWRECLRVLKPGGHLLAFAGTRTQHRMAVRIEDAGFEIRDMIAWVYGSGFPKSLDVSKAIDKHGPNGQVPFREFAEHYESKRKAAGLTHAKICEVGGWHGSVNHGGTSANWANGYSMPTTEQWLVLQPLLGLGDEWGIKVKREQYEREILGMRPVSKGVAFTSEGLSEVPITAPASEAACQWDGWGTALKPSLEPITVARKPLIGTVAENVIEFGAGALNIDGCRVPTDDPTAGRWPANLVHDGSEEVTNLFPFTKSGKPGTRRKQHETGSMSGTLGMTGDVETGIGDSGSAARFFYTAKATSSERSKGMDGEKNRHVSVKPLDLMCYLVRLVTPPAGIVVDPFMGSGPTGIAAMLHHPDTRFIGIEMEEPSFQTASKRIANWHKYASKDTTSKKSSKPDGQQATLF